MLDEQLDRPSIVAAVCIAASLVYNMILGESPFRWDFHVFGREKDAQDQLSLFDCQLD